MSLFSLWPSETPRRTSSRRLTGGGRDGAWQEGKKQGSRRSQQIQQPLGANSRLAQIELWEKEQRKVVCTAEGSSQRPQCWSSAATWGCFWSRKMTKSQEKVKPELEKLLAMMYHQLKSELLGCSPLSSCRYLEHGCLYYKVVFSYK